MHAECNAIEHYSSTRSKDFDRTRLFYVNMIRIECQPILTVMLSILLIPNKDQETCFNTDVKVTL